MTRHGLWAQGDNKQDMATIGQRSKQFWYILRGEEVTLSSQAGLRKDQ